jgi:arylsulfatase A
MPPYVFVENDRPTVPPSEKIAASQMRRYGGDGYWREGAIAPGFRHVDTLPTLADKAVQFVKRQDAKTPFFLYFPLTGPHTPWMPLEEFRGKSGAGYYGDFVAQVDATVGRLLDALVERKLADNTLVIFTSDNGAHWLPSDIETWKHRSNANWRGQKSDLWEGGHRVPFIVRYPKLVTPGTRSEQLVCLTDVLATVAEVIGQPLGRDCGEDSFSIAGVLRGKNFAAAQREAIVHQSGDGTLAVREGRWKLATKLGSHGFSEPKMIEPVEGGPRGQLYDLVDDPGEQHNRWLDKPEIVQRLNGLLGDYERLGRSRPVAD